MQFPTTSGAAPQDIELTAISQRVVCQAPTISANSRRGCCPTERNSPPLRAPNAVAFAASAKSTVWPSVLHCTSGTVPKDVVALEADDGSVHLCAHRDWRSLRCGVGWH